VIEKRRLGSILDTEVVNVAVDAGVLLVAGEPPCFGAGERALVAELAA
jgi:hypothetical protein